MSAPSNPNLPLFTAKGASITVENQPQVTAISLNITKSTAPDGSSKYNITAVLDLPLPEPWKALQGQTIPLVTVMGEGNSRKLTQASFFYDASSNTLYGEALTLE